ncbi:hypothetical protein QJQ45_001449 [Haematococcus lacustris]|nr:hypothetical protein QJQ45_001449 [Haematococcus lacustris]
MGPLHINHTCHMLAGWLPGAGISVGSSVGSGGLGPGVTELRTRPQESAPAPYAAEFVDMPHPSWTPGTPQPMPFPGASNDASAWHSLPPSELELSHAYSLMISCIVPRPIALVSSCSEVGTAEQAPQRWRSAPTLSLQRKPTFTTLHITPHIARDGAVNVSPYSYFNAMGHAPPIICIGINRAASRGGAKKDTLNNIEATGPLAAGSMGRLHGLAGGDFPPEVDEMALAGLHPVPSVKVKAPRLAESAIHMECKLRQVVDITNAEGKPSTAIVIAEVVLFHVHHGVTTKSPTGKLVVDPVALAPISRMGGTTYARTTQLFDIGRPSAAQAQLGPADYTRPHVQQPAAGAATAEAAAVKSASGRFSPLS